jgi:hypothetical protein
MTLACCSCLVPQLISFEVGEKQKPGKERLLKANNRYIGFVI